MRAPSIIYDMNDKQNEKTILDGCNAYLFLYQCTGPPPHEQRNETHALLEDERNKQEDPKKTICMRLPTIAFWPVLTEDDGSVKFAPVTFFPHL